MAGNKKFDIDLKYGQIRENKVREMFSKCQIEVKSERSWWKKTGNIAIEYESYGKPSGINATESDYWFHNLCIGKETYATLVFNTDILRNIINSLDYKRSVSGGDHNASRMYLVNIQKLFSSDVIKTFRERETDNEINKKDKSSSESNATLKKKSTGDT